jgi:GMC oxidoreductase
MTQPSGEFDFIVVGGMIVVITHFHTSLGTIHNLLWFFIFIHLHKSSGGTAGCVVVGRLAESPNVKVLVIEAGIGYVVDALFVYAVLM